MYNIKNQIFQKYSSKEDRDKLLTIYPDCFEYLKSTPLRPRKIQVQKAKPLCDI